MSISAQLQRYIDQIQTDFEYTVPYMYIDTTKNVTVGVGHNLTAHGDLDSLAFKVKRLTRKAVISGDTGVAIGPPKTIDRKATNAEKQNDYNFLKKNWKLGNFGPTQLQLYTTVEMESADICKLFDADIQAAISVAQNTFPGFNQFPVSCQGALIDMAFNLGHFSKFHTLKAAINGTGKYAKLSWHDRWQAAGAHCKRIQVDDNRNHTITQWFNDGAGPSR